MLLYWAYLIVAILTEVFGTVCMKMANGFQKPWPSAGMVMGYGLSFYFMTIAIKRIDVTIAYATWSGVGNILIALAGFYYFQEPMHPAKLISIGLIVLGVIGLNLSGTAH